MILSPTREKNWLTRNPKLNKDKDISSNNSQAQVDLCFHLYCSTAVIEKINLKYNYTSFQCNKNASFQKKRLYKKESSNHQVLILIERGYLVFIDSCVFSLRLLLIVLAGPKCIIFFSAGMEPPLIATIAISNNIRKNIVLEIDTYKWSGTLVL